jgi:hypothetical protein
MYTSVQYQLLLLPQRCFGRCWWFLVARWLAGYKAACMTHAGFP